MIDALCIKLELTTTDPITIWTHCDLQVTSVNVIALNQSMKAHGLIIQWYMRCVLIHFWKHCISRLTMEQDCVKSMMFLVNKCFYSIQLLSDWTVKHGCQSISVILYFYTNVEITADQFPMAEHVFNYVQIWCNLHASSVWSRRVWSESFFQWHRICGV